MEKLPLFVEVRIPFDRINDAAFIEKKIRKKLKKVKEEIFLNLIRKSIDARKSPVTFLLRYELSEKPFEDQNRKRLIQEIGKVESTKKVLIIGAGPAGYFAALQCLRSGLKPIVVDRGKDVRARRRDLRSIQQFDEVNPDSNYCFGEGGAGTYSDGKLYTRSHKRGKIQDVLELLVAHGAKQDILIDAHPHIGSNKLPGIISNIRETIEEKGGEVHFNTKIVDFLIKDKKMMAAIDQDGKGFYADAFILATGHSARDIYKLLDKKNIHIEAKPFALGVRIEHPQPLIDEIQYKQKPRSENLPAASYKLTAQADDRGVFSFCMCPGGLIVPSATAPGELVVNGMSLSRRDSPYANSGVVTAIEPADLGKYGYRDKFACMDFQAHVEQAFFSHGAGTQQAPAQRLVDFIDGKESKSLPDTSYIPGIYSWQFKELLPDWVYARLRRGILIFEKNMKGYLTQEAVVVGLESRTSAPLKIPRNQETLNHQDVQNLFPCGEGAGYAGGILSAAMDGQNVARAVFAYVEK